VVFIDGYFFISGSLGGRNDAITVSGLDDGTSFNALSFAFAENAPDAIRGLAILNNRVWAFGSYSTEKYYNTGADFPFEPSRSEFIDKGLLTGDCWAVIDNTVCWVGSDKIVYRSGGATPQVISTMEVKEKLDTSTVETCFSFTDRGHEFFAVRTAEGPTLCYDVTTGLWSERTTGVGYVPWAVTCVANYNGVQYFGTDTGEIAISDRSAYTDLGKIVSGEAISRPLVRDGQLFTVDRLHLSAETGNSFATDPQIVLQTSRNGLEWGVERWRSLGAAGQYEKLIRWNALGQFRRAQIRFVVTDAIGRDLYGIHYEAS
jgi:hypothetical protein